MNRKNSFALQRRKVNSMTLFGIAICSFGCVLLISGNCFPDTYIWYASFPDKEMSLVMPQNNNRTVDAAYSKIQNHHRGITVKQFNQKNRLPYAEYSGAQLQDVQYANEAAAAFSFSSQLKRRLSLHGFGVIAADNDGIKRLYEKGFSSIYYDIYESDLPVFITVDAIFHAFHRSFDSLMETAEERRLYFELYDLLKALLSTFDSSDSAEQDAMTYLAVPFLILDETRQDAYHDDNHDFGAPIVLPEDVQQQAQAFVDMIYSETLYAIDFFGNPILQDFSLFYPRGHYGNSIELQRYFRAMKWLNHMPLIVHASTEQTRVPNHEQLANVLLKKIYESNQWERYLQIHSFYSDLIGGDNGADLQNLHKACCSKKSVCINIAECFRKQLGQSVRKNAQNGQVKPTIMKFFSTKFEYTAWVTEQTTQPQLNPQNPTQGRSMASPFDVAYALGSNRAATYLKKDLSAADGEQLASALTAARETMHLIPPDRVADAATSDWLRALMAASAPTISTQVPNVMKTALWHDRKIESVLAGWTEMRHDTLLMVEAMGGSGCDFPKAYVEPIPGVYASLAHAVDKMAALYRTIPIEEVETDEFFAHFQKTLLRLKVISERELAGKEIAGDDLAFVNEMMKKEEDTYTGERLYNGWYPRLYWSAYDWREFNADSGTDEPLVADVYTDAGNREVLEVATGHPGVLFVVMEMNGKSVLYSGAVSSFYTFTVSAEDRMNDNDWREELMEHSPERPAFTRSYWISQPRNDEN